MVMYCSVTGMEDELPADLESTVEEDNEAFRQEMVEYDAKQEQERLKQVSCPNCTI